MLFKTAAQLVHELTEAHDARRFLSLQKKLKGYKLLIIDELEYVPFSKMGLNFYLRCFLNDMKVVLSLSPATYLCKRIIMHRFGGFKLHKMLGL